MLPPYTGPRPRSRRLRHCEHAYQLCAARRVAGELCLVELRFAPSKTSGTRAGAAAPPQRRGFPKLSNRGLYVISHDQRGLLSLVHAAITRRKFCANLRLTLTRTPPCKPPLALRRRVAAAAGHLWLFSSHRTAWRTSAETCRPLEHHAQRRQQRQPQCSRQSRRR